MASSRFGVVEVLFGLHEWQVRDILHGVALECLYNN